MLPASLDAKKLYENSAEIHAAVEMVAVFAEDYRNHKGDPRRASNELREKLIQFFATYDRARTDQVETLRSLLIGELYKTAKPTPVGTVPLR